MHLWGDETWIQGFLFEKQYTYYGILPVREIASSSPLTLFSPIPPFGKDDLRACLTQSEASLLCRAHVVCAYCMCVHSGVYVRGFVCVYGKVCAFHVYLCIEKHMRLCFAALFNTSFSLCMSVSVS